MMTASQIAEYITICRDLDPDVVKACQEIYSQPNYSVSWELAAAEIGYWFVHRRIEPSFQCIDRIIETSGGLIYVHKEPALKH